MTHIEVQYNDTPVKVAVKLHASDGSGYTVVSGMSALANRIISNMTPAQKIQYDFYQGQLNRVRKEY